MSCVSGVTCLLHHPVAEQQYSFAPVLRDEVAQSTAEKLCGVTDSYLDLLLICMMPTLGGKAVLTGGQEQNNFHPNNYLFYCLLSEKGNSLEC